MRIDQLTHVIDYIYELHKDFLVKIYEDTCYIDFYLKV